MPRGDRSGPQGYGPMTGRAAGFCAGYSMPGYLNPIPSRARVGAGRGFGGRGGGRGWRNQYYATGLTGWQRAAMGWPSAYPSFSPYSVVPPYAVAPTQVTPKQDADALKNQIKYLEESIKASQERIAELEE